MAKRKLKIRKFKTSKPIVIATILGILVGAFVLYFATFGPTAKFSASAQWQKLSGTTVSYSGGVLTFSVINDAGKDVSTSNVGLRVVGADRRAFCFTGITVDPKKPINGAPKCLAGCGSTIVAGGATQIQLNLAGSKCDPARIPKGTIMTAQLFFGDSEVQAEGKFLV